MLPIPDQWIAPIAALAGVLLGLVVNTALILWREGRESRARQSDRFVDHKRELYSTVLAEADQVMTCITLLGYAKHGGSEYPGLGTAAEQENAMVKAYERLLDDTERVRLFSDDVYAQCVVLRGRLVGLMKLEPDADAEEWSQTHLDYEDALTGCLAALRSDLGIRAPKSKH